MEQNIRNYDKCPLTNDELISACEKWVLDLCADRTNWTLSVPVNFKRDPDILFSELIDRFKATIQNEGFTNQPSPLSWTGNHLSPEKREPPVNGEGESDGYTMAEAKKCGELIDQHIGRMSQLEKGSVQHFIDKGTINGSFRLRLLAMMQFYRWHIARQYATSQPSPAKAEQEGPVEQRDESVEYKWDTFWKGIVCHPDGTINIDQLKKELHDFSYVMAQVPKVYCHITGNKLSKIMYPAETVITVADDHLNEIIDQEFKDYENDAQDFVETAEPKREQEGDWIRASDRLPEISDGITKLKIDGKDAEGVWSATERAFIVGGHRYPPTLYYIEWLDEKKMREQEGLRWVSCGKRMPTPEDWCDVPKQYLFRAKGDDPRSGWIYVGYMSAKEMIDAVKDFEYCEWLESAPKEATQPDPVAFDDAMEAEINKLPYTKHLDDGQYNDGQLAGFELGATWAKNYLQQTKQL